VNAHPKTGGLAGRWTLNSTDEMAEEGKTGLWVAVFVDFDSRRRLQWFLKKQVRLADLSKF